MCACHMIIHRSGKTNLLFLSSLSSAALNRATARATGAYQCHGFSPAARLCLPSRSGAFIRSSCVHTTIGLSASNHPPLPHPLHPTPFPTNHRQSTELLALFPGLISRKTNNRRDCCMYTKRARPTPARTRYLPSPSGSPPRLLLHHHLSSSLAFFSLCKSARNPSSDKKPRQQREHPPIPLRTTH